MHIAVLIAVIISFACGIVFDWYLRPVEKLTTEERNLLTWAKVQRGRFDAGIKAAEEPPK